MSCDWIDFLEKRAWLKAKFQNATVKDCPKLSISSDTQRLFPNLSNLLSSARATEVTTEHESLVLLAWDLVAGPSTGWLCQRAAQELPPTPRLSPPHQSLSRDFGGVVETWNDIQSWLLNMNVALTLEIAESDEFSADLDAIFDDRGTLPIQVSDWYVIAEEGNSNRVLCHRHTSDVIMMAGDHDFDFVTQLDNCPPYSLYRINGAPDIQSWVERVAVQWCDVVKLNKPK